MMTYKGAKPEFSKKTEWN